MTTRKSKNTKPIVLIRKKELLQIGLFMGLCIYMAQCTSSYKTTRPAIETRVSGTAEMRKRQDISTYAKKYIGSKYQYAGRSPQGFDCSGFTHFIMKNYDVDLVPISREQEKQGKVIAVDKAKPGDLLFFRRSKNGTVFHVALVVANDKDGTVIVHSSSSRGVVMDNISTNSYWKSKVITARDVLSK